MKLIRIIVSVVMAISWGISAAAQDPPAHPSATPSVKRPAGKFAVEKETDLEESPIPGTQALPPAPTPGPVPDRAKSGMKVGFGASSFYGSNAGPAEYVMSMSFSLFHRIPLDPSLKLQGEFGYSLLGAGNRIGDFYDSLRYIQLPLSLMLDLKGENYLYAGMAPALNVGGVRTYTNGPTGNLTGIAAFEFSGFLGSQVFLGPFLGQNVFLDVRAQMGLTNIDETNTVDLKNICFLGSFGYCFK